MIQHVITDRCGILSNVFYIAQLLKNLGFSYQQAKFVSDHLDEIARRRWRNHIWPQILQVARERKALLLFLSSFYETFNAEEAFALSQRFSVLLHAEVGVVVEHD